MAVAKKTPIPSASSQGGFPGVSKVTGAAPRGPNPVPIGDTGGAKRPMPGAVIKGPNQFLDDTKNPASPKVKAPESKPAPTIDSENQSAIAQGGGFVAQQLAMRPGMQRPADSVSAGGGLIGGGCAGSNVSSDPGGKTGGFPDSSGGDGSGRQPAQAGSTVSQTKSTHKGGTLPPGF